MRSRPPNSNHFFPPSQRSIFSSLVKFHLLIHEIECRQEGTQTPTGSALKVLCPHFHLFLLFVFFVFFGFLLLLFFFFCCCFFFLGGAHNLALIDLVVSEKMFEECGQRHRRACLYHKLTN